jgi:hypothetical protein
LKLEVPRRRRVGPLWGRRVRAGPAGDPAAGRP